MHVAALVLLFLSLVGCRASLAPSSPPSGLRACQEDLAACERRLVDAEPAAVPALLAQLDRARGDLVLSQLYQRLEQARPKTPVVRIDGAACPGCDDQLAGLFEVPASKAITKTKLDWRAIVAAVARAAACDQLVILDQDGVTQLFAKDPLEVEMAGSVPRIGVPGTRLGDALELARTLTRAFDAAGALRYELAANEGEKLSAALAAWPQGSEPRARAAYGAWLLARAGLSYETPTPDASSAQERAVDPPPGSSPYADLLLARMAGERHGAEYRTRRARIATEVSPARMAVLDRQLDDSIRCPAPLAPDITAAADLSGLGELAAALDDKVGPGSTARPGMLTIDAWLPRYDRAVELVERHKLGWLLIDGLLRQRGAIAGITVEGSAIFKRVSRLALDHLAAVEKLANAEPARVRALVLSGMAYQPGTATDPALRAAVAGVLGQVVNLKVRGARDVSGVYDAAMAAFALAMSYPAYLQGGQLVALSEALSAKLSGELASQQGWGVAGLHGARLALAWILGQENLVAQVAPRVIGALTGKDLPYPMLGALTAAVVRYAELVTADKLDASVANPKLFSAERAGASEALTSAIQQLSPSGPADPGEADFLRELGGFGDGLIAAAAASVREPRGRADSCADTVQARSASLKAAFERLQKKRKQLLALAAFKEGDGEWLRRARLLALLLSDALDVADSPKHKLAFTVSGQAAERIIQEALSGWIEGNAADVIVSIYPIVRTLAPEGKPKLASLWGNVARGIAALRRMFVAEGQTSLFSLLDDALNRTVPNRALGLMLFSDSSLAMSLTALAERAYQGGTPDQGDFLLLLAVGAAAAADETSASGTIALARTYDRPVLLPLLLRSDEVRAGADPRAFAQALDKALHGACRPPATTALTTVESALFDFRHGRRAQAVAALEQLLVQIEHDGLAVPRQAFRYREQSGQWVFTAEESVSLGSDLLANANTFNVGMGMQTTLDGQGGKLEVSLEPTASQAAREESARYYAHAAVLTAVLARIDGNSRLAGESARKAVATWSSGVRLGDETVPPSDKSFEWPRDASATIAIAAQQAADAGEPFLAGSLWAMVRRAIGDGANDAAVRDVVEPLPPLLRAIPEVEAAAKRAQKNLETLAAPLACTKKAGNAHELKRVSCADYPLALSLRIGEGLSELPRLGSAKPDEAPVCSAWRALDRFLGAANERRYEPDQFIEAVRALGEHGKIGDAAAVLANHRHQQHCAAKVIEQARELSRHDELGVYLRADVLSVAAMCGRAEDIALDVGTLDELTSLHALPLRNFEIVVFAAKLAKLGHRAPLVAITRREGFVERWRRIAPDLGALALLLHHSAGSLSGEPVSKDATLPAYRLLCATFPSSERGPICNAISALRASQTGDSKAAAEQALEQFIDTAGGILQAELARQEKR